MGSIGFNIYNIQYNAFPMKNDNWYNFQPTGTNNPIFGAKKIVT